MEFGVHQFQHIKLGAHIAQAVLMAISWCVCIAVFRSSASVDGRLGWYFGLVFLTVPAIIYETMTPRFPRTRKFANPYVLAAVDLLFCLLWLTAFASVASWNGTGKCKSGCGESKAVVALGVFVWLLFILTTFLSVYACMYYRREGYLPGLSRAPGNAAQLIDPDKEAFSTAPHDEYAPVHDADEHEIDLGHEHGNEAPSYAGAGESSQMGAGVGAGVGGGYADSAPAYGAYAPPRVDDEGAFPEHGWAQSAGVGPTGRLQFPSARYENV